MRTHSKMKDENSTHANYEEFPLNVDLELLHAFTEGNLDKSCSVYKPELLKC